MSTRQGLTYRNLKAAAVRLSPEYDLIMTGECGYRSHKLELTAVIQEFVNRGFTYSLELEFIIWHHIYEVALLTRGVSPSDKIILTSYCDTLITGELHRIGTLPSVVH